ncbi:type III secretion system inner membrane ring lipoprotein SctJ [Piscinibacter sp. HJYY11]|uniref:type III secretion system inner membrane ring lipoprotein SctJ n=1 Tax=Piscinibacter sp. HJYY11 TaxID=2801333 RepID=UPI00191F34BA|nr:type III secretion inner membrane ring lipoprotein SctJ [Piscinibacter sp. HJYY11]MBL0728162.1 type III secretion inner membrane ring lipoprotein SctJ [Piscinibacter sp. HJYY11]
MTHPASFFHRVLAALVLLLCLAGCKVGLYSNLNEQEANEIVAALAADGVDAAKERQEGNNWQVLVDEGRLGRALDILRAQGLPHDRYASMGDVFQKQGLVSTPAEERMRYIYAVSQELSQTLRKVDGVVTARVHVVIPANDPLSDKIRPSSAAVFIKHRPDVDLRLLAPAVKEMVAHSIEGLTHEQVSLSLFEARRTADAGPGAVPGERQVLGLPTQTAVVLLVLLLAAAVCVMVLPTLLRRQGLDWRTWVRRQVLRR